MVSWLLATILWELITYCVIMTAPDDPVNSIPDVEILKVLWSHGYSQPLCRNPQSAMSRDYYQHPVDVVFDMGTDKVQCHHDYS